MLPVLLLCFLAAAEPRMAVEVWPHGDVDFEELTTWDWVEPPALGDWSRRRDGRLTFDDRVRDALRGALEQQGLQQGAGDAAQFLVAFAVVPPDGRTRPNRFDMGRAVQGLTIELGSRDDDLLILELIDPESELPVWRGRAGPLHRQDVDLFEQIGVAAGRLLAVASDPDAKK